MMILAALLAAFVEGTVVGPGGKPLGGALVLARPAGGARRESAEAVRTDASGRFRLAARRSVLDLRVESPGMAAAVLSGVRAGVPVSIALRKGRTLEGVVREATTGEPVAEARVEAREEGGDRFAALWQPKAGTVGSRSDAKGRYRLEGLGDGLYTVAGRSRQHGRALRRSVVAGGRVDLLLLPGGALTGTVTGPDRKPVAGAVVRVEPEAVHIGRREGPLDGEVTDAAGRFDFAGLEPGTYGLVALHPDFAPAVVWGLSVAREAEARAEVALERGAAVSGRLVASPARPLAGRVALSELGEEPAPTTVAEVTSASIPGDGRFRLERLPRGSHALIVTAEGYAPRRVEVAVGTQDVDLGDVAVDAGLTIRGAVRDDAGRPVTGAQLTAFQARTGEGLVRGESQGDGAFVLPGLSAGLYHIMVSGPGYSSAGQDAAAGEDGVALVLRAAGAVTGTVVDAEGRVVETFGVAARAAARLAGPPEFQVFADGAGRFRIEGLAQAAYVLQVTAPGRGSTTAEAKVAWGGTTDVGRLRLSPTTLMRGTVVDGVGAPIAGAVVSAQAASAIAPRAPSSEVVTDPAGTFELAGVPTGPVDIVARHPDFADGRVRLAPSAEEDVAPLRITLARGGRLEGVVRTVAGTPPPLSFVRLETLGLVGVPLPIPDMVSTLRDGSFAFDHVPPGRSRLVLMTGRDGRFTRSEQKEIDVREGATTTVQFVSP